MNSGNVRDEAARWTPRPRPPVNIAVAVAILAIHSVDLATIAEATRKLLYIQGRNGHRTGLINYRHKLAHNKA